MTTIIEKPSAALSPAPDATCEPLVTCEQVRAIVEGAARRSACKKDHDKDLTGVFRLKSGSVAAGFVCFDYFKRRPDDPDQFLNKPAYFPIGSRDERGWLVTCSCLGSHAFCKHARYLRMALIAWPCEGALLLPLAAEDGDGWAGPCTRCHDPECYRVSFWQPVGGYQHYNICQTCGRRPRL